MSMITKISLITVKPFLSDKVTSFPQITLVENDEIIPDESKLQIHLVISLKMLSIHLVSKQMNIQMITTV